MIIDKKYGFCGLSKDIQTYNFIDIDIDIDIDVDVGDFESVSNTQSAWLINNSKKSIDACWDCKNYNPLFELLNATHEQVMETFKKIRTYTESFKKWQKIINFIIENHKTTK